MPVKPIILSEVKGQSAQTELESTDKQHLPPVTTNAANAAYHLWPHNASNLKQSEYILAHHFTQDSGVVIKTDKCT